MIIYPRHISNRVEFYDHSRQVLSPSEMRSITVRDKLYHHPWRIQTPYDASYITIREEFYHHTRRVLSPSEMSSSLRGEFYHSPTRDLSWFAGRRPLLICDAPDRRAVGWEPGRSVTIFLFYHAWRWCLLEIEPSVRVLSRLEPEIDQILLFIVA